jgi:ribosomal peptide maturation radical SAM protein 1
MRELSGDVALRDHFAAPLLENGIKDFVQRCADIVLAASPRIVCFPATLAAYQQNTPSLALARIIKQWAPATAVVLGGECAEGIMGVESLRQFPFVDVAISGESDLALPAVVQRLLARGGVDNIRGVYTRDNTRDVRDDSELVNAAIVEDLDRLPIPDHDEYFAQLAQDGLSEWGIVTMETSRGCWWTTSGNWCRFCSFFGKGPGFRRKSARRALEELRALVRRYRPEHILTTDFVLDKKHFDDFIPQLGREPLGVEIFYEVRADLTRDQIRQLAAAGVTKVQVGVESLSGKMLRDMGKGVTALQNIQFLKWAHEFGLRVRWNVICALPTATPAECSVTEDRMALVSHLGAHARSVDFVLQRYSPYFRERDRHFTRVTPAPAYRFIFRELDPDAVQNLAYNFTFQTAVERADPSLERLRVSSLIASWKEQESALLYFEPADDSDRVFVIDLRPVAVAFFTELEETAAFAFKSCDGIQTIRNLQALAEARGLTRTSIERIQEALDDLVWRKLVVREGDSYLSLAVPLAGRTLSERLIDRLVSKAEEHGVSSALYSHFQLAAPESRVGRQ